MANSQQLEGLMGTTMDKIRQMVDVNTIIGEAITIPDGTVIIPVSKVTFGFASGGSDLPFKNEKDNFGGGAGAGVTVKPEAFLIIKAGGDVQLLELGQERSSGLETLTTTLPEVVGKIKAMFAKDKGKSDDEDALEE